MTKEETPKEIERIKKILPVLSQDIQAGSDREIFIKFGERLWEL
ncbi:MAG: hypothetical protein ABIG20_00720 [archaeon]